MNGKIADRIRLHPIFYGLKNRVITVLLLSTLLPLLLSGAISYVSITSILDNKIHSSVQSNLRQVKISFENTLANLNHVSQQLAFNGSIGNDLAMYLENRDLLEKLQLEKEIQKNVNLIRFSNPDLGHMFYFFSDTQNYVLSDMLVEEKFDFEKHPKLLSTGELTYYGPHPTTLSKYIDRMVLSITRKVDVPEYDNLYVYIETSYQLTQDVLAADKSAMNISHLIVDGQNRITYSENPDHFVVGADYKPYQAGNGMNESEGHYLFEENHNQGWKLVAAIPKADYNSEKNLWFRQFGFFICLAIGIALMFAWVIWRTIRLPLGRFNNEIKKMQNSHFHSPLEMTKIIEFDFVLRQFQVMRKRIWELLQEVKEKEKRKSEMEMEKLLFQINPHFIHNTLDTIRWLARSKGLYEIDKLIFSLNQVLYYNMGKSGVATVQEELNAMNNYVELQRIRYDFDFSVVILADSELLQKPIPRFILQPLVENSLYHGLQDEGEIRVQIHLEEDNYMIIQVKDNGAGMTEEDIEQLLQNQSLEQRKVGMGIGLYYVNRIINVQFGDQAKFDIHSKLGEGTIMTLCIPIELNGSS
ncbi:sensor histidine kinase [Paenibacillus sp. strain BS8-2]